MRGMLTAAKEAALAHAKASEVGPAEETEIDEATEELIRGVGYL